MRNFILLTSLSLLTACNPFSGEPSESEIFDVAKRGAINNKFDRVEKISCAKLSENTYRCRFKEIDGLQYREINGKFEYDGSRWRRVYY